MVVAAVGSPGNGDHFHQLGQFSTAMPMRKIAGGIAAADEAPAMSGMFAAQQLDEVESVAAGIALLIAPDHGPGSQRPKCQVAQFQALGQRCQLLGIGMMHHR